MGLFDFLFGGQPASKVEVLVDRIWLSQHAKLNGIRAELESRSQAGSAAILLVGHFPDTVKQLDALAARYRAADDQAAEGSAAEGRAAEGKGRPLVAVTLADRPSRDLVAQLSLTGEAAVDVIVAERHPLFEMDDNLKRLLEELPWRCRLVHHLSLEDPLLQRFAGEWVGSILQKLGLSADEAIESALVQRRIKEAQKKIQAEVFGSARAASAAEWMETNLPNTSRM